jgi:hypothetical protein
MQPDFQQMVQNVYTLAPLTSNLPVVQAPDGEDYVPLRALCEIVGLNPSSYIGVFCQYCEPGETRRLLIWNSPTGKRKDWCLLRSHLVYWLVNVPVDRVPPDRREAVLALQHQCAALLGSAYMQMQEQHQHARRVIFRLLNICAAQEQELRNFEIMGNLLFDEAHQQMLALRLAEGRELVDTLADAARKMLARLMEGPIVDGVVLNKDHEVIDTTSFPLFPIVQDPDPATLETIDRFREWITQFNRWWDLQMESKR